MSRTISRIAGVLISLVFVFALFPGFKIKAAEIVDQGECGIGGSNVTWTLDSDGTLTISGSGEMEESAFYGNNYIKKVVIENGVTSIGDDAFSDCARLWDITIPNSVTSIGNSAFQDCRSLTSITIPNSVTSIGDSAFGHCENLTSITIPNSVTSIGDLAFLECKFLTSITIPNSVTSIGDSAFEDCTSLTSIIIDREVYEKTSSAFNGISPDVLDIYYNATYETSPAGGSIKGNAEVHGSDEITITPDQHYSVDKVLFTVKDKNGKNVEKELSPVNGKYLMPDYDFNNWTGDCKVTASFKLVKYHVEFLDGDETVLQSDDLEYGKFPSYTGKTPEKQESETSTFTFDGWTNGSEIYGLDEKLPEITGDVTYTPVFKENTKPVYTVGEVKGDGINSDIVIDVHRNVDDENCIDYFGSATIDGKDMKVNEQYTVTKGSTIITIKKDFLSTLTAGEHEVKIIFSDGSITTKVTVAAKAPAQAQDPAKTNSSASIPSTGEAKAASTYTGLALVVAACVCGTGVVLLKKRKEA